MSVDPAHFDDVLTYLESVELPESVSGIEKTEGGPIDLVTPAFDRAIEQSVVVGSQIAGFSPEVPAEIRPMISNVFLLAQLVADKKTDKAFSGSRNWYEQYIEVFTKVGWNIRGQSHANQTITGSSLEVHREIVPVIAAALGPAAAAGSTIIRVLNGLGNMSKDQPWITLFNQKSHRASANQFQLSQTNMEGDVPITTLIAFDLDAQQSVTQVLFFKFSSGDASLTYFERKMSANLVVLKHSANQVQNLVLDHITGNITDLGKLGL